MVAAAVRVGGAPGRELLREALTSARWDVRLAAAQAIGERGDHQLREAARRAAASEPDPLVARALADAARVLAREPGR